MSRAALTLARAALAQIIPTLPAYREQHAQAMAAIDAALAEPAAARVPQWAEKWMPTPHSPGPAAHPAAARVPLTGVLLGLDMARSVLAKIEAAGQEGGEA